MDGAIAIARAVALVAALALGAWGAARVELTTDTTELLPTEGVLRRTLIAARDGSGSRSVLIELDGTGAPPGALAAEVEALAGRLRALPAVADVRTGFLPADGADVHRRVAPYAAAFAPEDALAERTSEAGVRAELERARSRLAGFGGVFLAGRVREDPLDLAGLATRELAGATFPGVSARDGLLLDATGERALILVRSAVLPAEVVPDDARVAALAESVAGAGLPARWAGGVRVASETATSIYADVQRVSVLGTALLALVLLFGFRSWRPVIGAAPPLLVAAGLVAGAAWAASPLHGLQLGFGAALAGVAVDYWIHVYLAAAERVDQEGFAGRHRAATAAVRELLPALALSAGSTIAAFALLATSELPLIRVLGVTGAAAAAGALLGSAVVGPLVWAALGRPAPTAHRPPTGRGAAVALAGVIGLAAGAPWSAFDPDPLALLRISDAARADQDLLTARYGGGDRQGLILLEAGDDGRALDRSARVEAALAESGFRVAGPARVLPGPAVVARRRERLPDADTLQSRLDAASDELGLPRFEGAGARARATAEVPPVDLWSGSPLEARVSLSGGAALVSVALREGDEARARAALAGVDPEARLVVPGGVAAEGLRDARGEVVTRAGLAAVAVGALLVARHRALGRAGLAMLPAGAAFVGALGAMGWSGRPWNPVSLAAMVPVLGLAVDYGVFMTESSRAAPRAVVLSALTTLAGFAPLLLAESPALAGVGVATTAGIGCAAAVALAVLPAFEGAR